MKQQNTALLVMDMQPSVLAGLQDPKPLLANVAKAIDQAHQRNILVIYVVVGFRTGVPEINPNNKIFGGNLERYSKVSMGDMVKVHPDLVLAAKDVTVVKHRVSAFAGSDLDMILRSQGIQHLILTGMSASGVVLSTLREAADKDFLITVLADCCGDRDEEIHRVLTTKVFVSQAEVLSLQAWCEQ